MSNGINLCKIEILVFSGLFKLICFCLNLRTSRLWIEDEKDYYTGIGSRIFGVNMNTVKPHL